MLLNYLTIGFRNILKYKGFSFINVFGLALAMSVAMLLLLMLADQKQYDQFNARKNNTYRILSDDHYSPFPYASTPVPLAQRLTSEFPVVEKATHLIRGVGGDAVYRQQAMEMRGFFADPDFFNIFSFELEKGNAATALVGPRAVVITHSLALQLFHDEDPLGKTIDVVDRGLHYLGGYRNEPPPVPWGSFTITGVIADKHYKSHLKFDALISSSSMSLLQTDQKIKDLGTNWENFYECFTYVLLRSDATQHELESALEQLVKRQYLNVENFKDFKLTPQALTEITPGQFTANMTSFSMPLVGYYLLAFLAVVIIASASLNYTNLSIARALTRAKEIGVRKVNGAGRKALLLQFMTESILTAFLALIMAGVMVLLLVPALKGLWINRYLNFDLHATMAVYAAFAGLALVIGILAGLYPALRLSSFQPVQVLRGNPGAPLGKYGMRRALGILQFTIAFFFVTTALLLSKQFRHFLDFDYGLATSDIVNIPLRGNDYEKVRAGFGQIAGVSTISACDIVPATGISNGTNLRKAGLEEYKYFGMLKIDEYFTANMGIKLLAGRNLPEDNSSGRVVLINEAGARELGYATPAEIVGQVLEEEGNQESIEVIGVVEDFRFKLLIEQDKIGPLILRNQSGFNFANVKIVSGDKPGTLAKIEEKWKAIDPVHPFQYEFFTNQLATTHQGIFDAVSVLSFVSLLAITIACLGLLGMTTFATERRKREVGIRKVLGATNTSLATLLSKEFLLLLLFSVAIAAPLSYFLNTLWLQRFPNRVEFGLSTVLSGTAILMVLGLLTIGSQTVRATKRNPVDLLKMD